MARDQIDPVLQQIHRLVGEPDTGELTDRQLLERFAYARDQVAFTALVRRHGSLVLGVSGRLLHHAQDAEDVFQATFLVLARKAGSMGWQASVRNWLYQVACRLAKKARAARARPLVQERRAAEMPKSEVPPESAWRELCSVLDEELQRLPSKYRQPLLLCYLEGLTTDQAAQELNWSLRTLKRRLEQGRELMRLRLTGRGLTLSAAILSAGLARKASAVPAVLTAGTVKAAVEFAAGSGTASISANVMSLTEGALRGLATARARIAVAIVLLVGLGSAGTGAALYHVWSADLPDATHLELQEPDARAQANQVILEEPGTPAQAKSVRNDLFGDPLPPGALARLGTVQWRHHHSGGMGVAFSPDGKAVATSGDSSLRLWNTATGKTLWRLQDENNGFGRVLFSPNGKWLAVRSGTLLDAATGRVLRQISPGGYLLAISPDSSLMATSKRDPSVTVYDAATGQEVRHLPASEGDQVTSGIFTPDSQTLLTLSFTSSGRNRLWRKQLRQWDMTTGALRKTIDLKIPQWRTLSFSNDAKSLAVVPYSLEAVSLWDVETGKERCKLQGKPACARYGLAFSPEGKTLSTDWTEEGSTETLISLWDAGTGKFLRRFAIPSRCAGSLYFSPDGRTLLTDGEQRVRLWDTLTGQSFAGPPGHDGQVYFLSFTPDGNFLLSSGWDSSVRVWEVATARHLHEYPGPFLGVSAVAALPDSRTFLSTADNDLLYLRDIHTGKELRRAPANSPEKTADQKHRSMSFAMSAGGRTAVTLSSGGKTALTVNLWDLTTGQKLLERAENPKPQWSLFSPSAKIMIGYIDTPQGNGAPVGKIAPKMAPWMKAGGAEQRPGNTHVVLQEVATGRQLLTLPQPDYYGHHAAFSPDERTLVTSTYRVLPGDNGSRWESHNLHLWELATGRERLTIKIGKDDWQFLIGQIAFAPDGRTFAIARIDRTIQLLDVATGKELLRHTGYDAPVYCLAFTPNARALASGHSDSTILLWDLSPALRPRAVKALATSRELEQWWSDLASVNARNAHAAIWAMVDQPVSAPGIISRRIQPAREIPVRPLHQYIADLDSNQFQVREEAGRQLANLEEEALPALREALKGNPSPEQRRRIEALLAVPSIVRSPESLRQLRAVEVLEHIGSSEAREMLAKLAAGAPNARLTQEASASWERLKRRSTVPLHK